MCTGIMRGVALSAALVCSGNAFAMLGGTLDTVDADQQRMGAVHQTAPAGVLIVHTLSDSQGGTVREYASSSGVVVGVTWSGPGSPDLKQLFGDAYFSRFSAAQNAKKVLVHHRFALRDPDLVIEASGGMHRLYTGRAYLPSALPSGVTPDQLP